MRDSPSYPEPRWFTALARADADFQRLGPLKLISRPGTGHNAMPPSTSGVPEGSGKQLYAHQYGARGDLDRLSSEVNAA